MFGAGWVACFYVHETGDRESGGLFVFLEVEIRLLRCGCSSMFVGPIFVCGSGGNTGRWFVE